MSSHTLKGKGAVVGAGAKNLGGLISREPGKGGANVLVHYNSDPTRKDAEATVKAIKDLGSDAFAIQGDLTKPANVAALFKRDSHNSSQPPSSDPPFKKPLSRALRQRSGKKPGGQKDHPGATRTLVDDPEHTIVIPLAGHCACGRALETLEVEELPERRQVVELVVRREATEYRTVAGRCACGRVQRSTFPAAVDAPVQYGPGVAAFAVHLTQYRQLPYRQSRAGPAPKIRARVWAVPSRPISHAADGAAGAGVSARRCLPSPCRRAGCGKAAWRPRSHRSARVRGGAG